MVLDDGISGLVRSVGDDRQPTLPPALALVSLAACALPALRAARLDPASMLHEE